MRNGGVALSDLDDERATGLFIALEEAFRAEEQGFEAVCARIEDPRVRDLVIRKVSSGEFDMNQERMVADGVRRIRQRALEEADRPAGRGDAEGGKGIGGSRADAGAARGEDASGQRAGKTEDEGGRGLKTKGTANHRREQGGGDEQGAPAARDKRRRGVAREKTASSTLGRPCR